MCLAAQHFTASIIPQDALYSSTRLTRDGKSMSRDQTPIRADVAALPQHFLLEFVYNSLVTKVRLHEAAIMLKLD